MTEFWWYHGTDSTETVSTQGLNKEDFFRANPSDERGFFVTPSREDAADYAHGKTELRIALGEIPPDSVPVVLRAKSERIEPFLKEPEFAHRGERFIPVADFPKVPRDAFQKD